MISGATCSGGRPSGGEENESQARSALWWCLIARTGGVKGWLGLERLGRPWCRARSWALSNDGSREDCRRSESREEHFIVIVSGERVPFEAERSRRIKGFPPWALVGPVA